MNGEANKNFRRTYSNEKVDEIFHSLIPRLSHISLPRNARVTGDNQLDGSGQVSAVLKTTGSLHTVLVLIAKNQVIVRPRRESAWEKYHQKNDRN